LSDYETARAIALNLLAVGDPLDESRVRAAAENAVRAISAQEPGHVIDVDALVRELEANINVVVADASTLVDNSRGHITWLADKRSQIKWSFSRRYTRFLREKRGWATRTLQRTNEITDQVIGLLEDPARPTPWDSRGMVVGQVQSGKTSNYIALICKAADAGYKFIVVLTGTTNSLRAQTQLRIDEGFLGWDTRLNLALSATNRKVGVGTLVGEPLLRAIPSTNGEETGDFSLRIANQFNVRLGGDPVIMVVKKNGSVLRNLTRWARSLSPVDPTQKIPGIPLLVIDDEADFASVNTRPLRTQDEQDVDPTVINKRIRELLDSFAASAYVGYTATPFANIFIFPDVTLGRYGDDLFPRDFLISLPEPSNHVGPTKLFGLRADSTSDIQLIEPLPLLVTVDDHTTHIPSVHRKDLIVDDLPNSLREAIRAFILVCAARAVRRIGGNHNSMLVHVTRFVNVQAQVAELVGLELSDLQNRIRYGDGASPSQILTELKTMWGEDFAPVSERVRTLEPGLAADCSPVTWDQLREELIPASQRIQVKTINGSAQDVLDYWDHTDGLSVIAIGGDKLSRGLTLEGLSVSYYLRSSHMYDTLLQMGRWFGYRPGYVDLCRLYTSEELSEFYSHITLATEELKRDFDMMADRGMTPSQFGLRVRTHPSGLVITAANKMRNGTIMSVSYAGDISETISFDRNIGPTKANYIQVDRFIRGLTGDSRIENQNRIWGSVPGDKVADLLASLVVHESSRKARGVLLARYIRSQLPHGGLTDWTVVLISNPGNQNSEVGGYAVRPVQRTQYPSDARDRDAVYRIRRLVSPTDELIDLTDVQRGLAREKTAQFFQEHPERTRYQVEPTKPGGPFIRQVRSPSNGLLLLYPLDEPNPAGVPFLGFAVSFPGAQHDTPIEYAVNTVYGREELEE
jgi:hypothetical protein